MKSRRKTCLKSSKSTRLFVFWSQDPFSQLQQLYCVIGWHQLQCSHFGMQNVKCLEALKETLKRCLQKAEKFANFPKSFKRSSRSNFISHRSHFIGRFYFPTQLCKLHCSPQLQMQRFFISDECVSSQLIHITLSISSHQCYLTCWDNFYCVHPHQFVFVSSEFTH